MSFYDHCDGKCYRCPDSECENNPRCPVPPSLDDVLDSIDLSEFNFPDDELPF